MPLRAVAILALCLAALSPPVGPVWAAGTPAGTEIVSQARVTFEIGAVPQFIISNQVRTTVQEVLEVRARWTDPAAIVVNPGDTDQALSFIIVNGGNGSEALSLSALGELAGNDFDPVTGAIHLDGDGNGLFDPVEDPPYLLGNNEPFLAADDSLRVFLLADIPPGPDLDDVGLARLTAAALTGHGAPGTVLTGAGDGGTDAVVGLSGAEAADDGIFLISTVYVTVAKSATVADPYGGDQPVTNAVITYSLEISASGIGTAMAVVLVDSIPANASYRSGSLTFNHTPLTDALDGDAGDVGVTTPGVVTVFIGDLSVGDEPRVVTFNVTIH